MQSRTAWLTRLKPYAFAVGMVALMAALRRVLDALLGEQYPFVLFLAAVFVSSWYFGWKAGLLALGLGLLAADFLFISPRGSIGNMSLENQVGIVLYTLVAVVNMLLIETLRRAKQRSELQSRTLGEEVVEHRRTQEALRQATTELERRVDQRTAELTQSTGHLRQETSARQEAEANVHRLAALVASCEDGIIGITLDGVITDWNIGAEHLFGYAVAEVVGQSVLLLLSPEERDEGKRTLEQLRQGEEVLPYEAVRLRKDGSPVTVSVRLSAIKQEGRILGCSLIYRDLTSAKRLEAQYRQAQKMEAIGRLAGGVAHDFNNLLTIIIGYSDLLLGSLRAGDPLREFIEQIRAAGGRASSLTRQLLAFSRKQLLVPVLLDLNALLTEMEKMLTRLIGEDIALRLTAAPQLWPVKVDPGQMEQVIMNLVVNARDAMPEGGELTIETANLEVKETPADVQPTIQPGPYVRVAVRDTGCGMDEATRARIFEPFFTTKGPERGTGLGLATVYGIIRQSGGGIQVSSAVGVGTTFQLYLPRAQEEGPTTPPQAGLLLPLRGAETVLVVEDGDGVRRLTCTVLEEYGYYVLEARTGAEALQVCEQIRGPIHLLVTDVVMPAMSGRQLAERLARLRPGLKVLYLSGYTDDALVHYGVLAPGTSLLQKPFSPDVLARTVREVLDQEAPRASRDSPRP